MTAASADYDAHRSEGELQEFEVYGSTTIYKGTLVALRTDGYAIPAADTADLIVVGVAYEKVDNSAGSSGAKRVKVHCKSGEHFVYAYNGTPAITNVGEVAYVVDDKTVGNTSTNGVKVGRIVEVYTGSTSQPSPQPDLTSSEVRVKLDLPNS